MSQVSSKLDRDRRLPAPVSVTDAKSLTPPPPASVEDPKEDLLFTGMVDGTPPVALFEVTEPGKRPVSFTLAESEQNEWLAIESIDINGGTVKARLKKPVVRIRNVGAEVLLSFQIHGRKRSQPTGWMRLP